jgi:hypothetical protein
MNTELKNHMIDLYRESINKRYTFENIKKDPNLPKSFTKETVDELRDFFLDNLYSSPKERDKLDKAFSAIGKLCIASFKGFRTCRQFSLGHF